MIVPFTAPWCGHCKRLKPVYEEVTKDFANEPNVSPVPPPLPSPNGTVTDSSPLQCLVVNVDADTQNNWPLDEKYSVGSFPTIKFFPKGAKDEPLDYDGARTEEAFVTYLNEKCDAHHAGGGLLNE